MTARALIYKEALLLRRSLWLPLCSAIAIVFPLAANMLATAPLFELDTCFLIISVAVACFGGELVFRTTVGERRAGTLDVLLAAVPDRLLLTLCKLLLPAVIAALCTVLGLAANDMLAPLYGGRELFSEALTARSVIAVAFTSVISGSLELVLLSRSREAVPLHGSTALIAAVVAVMSCLYAAGWRLSPLLPVAVSAALAFSCVKVAAQSLSCRVQNVASHTHRPDVLFQAASPPLAVAMKDAASIRSWLSLAARYAVLIALGALVSMSGSRLSPAAWFPAATFPAAEMLYPSLLSETTAGAMDILRTALGSVRRTYLYKSALPFALSQLASAAAAIFVSTPAAGLLELYTAASLALACLFHRRQRAPESARYVRLALYGASAVIYAAGALLLRM